MKIGTRAGVALSVACALGQVAALATAAESSTAETAASNPVRPGNALDEIVVTATKRVENLQVVPLTVDVVSQKLLQSQNLTNTTDLTRLVPELNFRHAGTPGNDAFNIRGVETLATSNGLEQSAGVAFDGVSLARPVGSVADLVDIHSVEVLMGPQGMLFGKNASAGLVNIVSNSPVLGTTDVTARVSYGTLNNEQYSGTVNYAVTDDSALRLTAWKFLHDGTIHELNTGQYMNDKDSDGGRLKYLWAPTQALDINFTAEWVSHNQNGTGYSIRSFDPSFYNPSNQGAQVAAYELGKGTVPSESNRNARGLDNPYYDRGHTNAYTVQGDYRIGDGTITAIVATRKIGNTDSFDPFPSDNPYNQQFKNTDVVDYEQWSEELRYASPVEERLRYVVGLFNFHLNLHDETGFGVSGVLGPAPPAQVLVDADFLETIKNNNYAGFGELTFDITKQLHFIAGVRRSTDQLSASMNRSGANTMFLGGPFAASTSTEYNDISWRTGVQFEATPDAMLYATFSRGYKGPGIGYSLSTSAAEIAATHGDIVKPEIVHAFEVGLKSKWFDHRLTVNMSVYKEIFDDFQTSVILPGNIFSIVALTNANQLTSTGGELNLRWAVTPYVSVMADEAYVNARYTNFKGAACYTGQSVEAGCVTSVTAAGTTTSQDATGKRLANTPRETAGLTARFEHPINASLSGFVQANGTYRSNVNYSSLGDPLDVQGGYTLLNLSAGIDSTDGHWGVQVYANNALDRHYVDMVVANGLGNAVFFNDIGYEDLRTFGIALNVHF